MAYTSQENAVNKTFDKAMDQINRLQRVFRDDGMLAKAVVDIGGDQDFSAIQEAFDNVYGALEDGHYDAMAHLAVEEAKQKLGMNEEPETTMSIPAKVVELAGDSIWDRDGKNPKSVKVSKIEVENPYEPGGYMDDDEDDGYRKVDVEHDGPWTIYTDSGFEEAISKIVGFRVVFTEQGMQEDGMASMEGGSEGFVESKESKMEIDRLKNLAGSKESIKEYRMSYGDADKLGRENASKIDNILRRRVADSGKDIRDVEMGDLEEMRWKIAKELGLVESKIAEPVAETNTGDDAGEEIKEQSSEITRLKQLIGTGRFREMK